MTQYILYQNYITNQNRPILIQCSRSLFIGDLRDFSKILHLPIRQEPTVIQNRPISQITIFFILDKITFQILSFHTRSTPTPIPGSFVDLYTSGSRPANTWHARGTVPCMVEPHPLFLVVLFLIVGYLFVVDWVVFVNFIHVLI